MFLNYNLSYLSWDQHCKLLCPTPLLCHQYTCDVSYETSFKQNSLTLLPWSISLYYWIKIILRQRRLHIFTIDSEIFMCKVFLKYGSHWKILGHLGNTEIEFQGDQDCRIKALGVSKLVGPPTLLSVTLLEAPSDTFMIPNHSYCLRTEPAWFETVPSHWEHAD